MGFNSGFKGLIQIVKYAGARKLPSKLVSNGAYARKETSRNYIRLLTLDMIVTSTYCEKGFLIVSHILQLTVS